MTTPVARPRGRRAANHVVAYFNEGDFVTDGEPQRIGQAHYLASAWEIFSEGLLV